MENTRFVVGIDPGIVSGFAIFDRKEKKLIVCKSCELWDLFDNLRNWKGNGIYVFIENPNTWVPFKGISKEDSESKKQRAGGVKQTFKHITEYLDHLCLGYKTTKLQGTLKKTKAEDFKKITKWEGKSNEHSRDAGLLCFNR